LEVTLMEEERRRKKTSSREREERERVRGLVATVKRRRATCGNY